MKTLTALTLGTLALGISTSIVINREINYRQWYNSALTCNTVSSLYQGVNIEERVRIPIKKLKIEAHRCLAYGMPWSDIRNPGRNF